MAIIAIECSTVCPVLMCSESKSERIMGYIGLADIRQGPTMLKMAVTTDKTRVALFQVPVQRGRVLLLGDNIRVTGLATVGHGFLLPGSAMAGRAFSTEFGMGGHASKRSTS